MDAFKLYIRTGEIDQAEYLPTPDEIAEACLRIQSTWTEDERMRRMDVSCQSRLLDQSSVDRGQQAERQARQLVATRERNRKPSKWKGVIPKMESGMSVEALAPWGE